MIESWEIRCAAVEAVKRWKEEEGDFAERLKSLDTPVDEDLLRRWMDHWGVLRNVKKASRADLAAYLDGMRCKLLKAPCKELPGMVEDISECIKKKKWSANNGRPTSLVSKFVFSLRSKDVAPYDKRARCALGIIYRKPLKDHDYKAFLNGFERFADDIDQRLEETKAKMTDKFKAEKEASMSDRLFKRRSADKALMLIGGFKFDLSTDCVSARFSH